MPIEFRCSNCGRLLRTGDDTVGRQAQCPECGVLTPVPSAEVSGAVPPLAPLGTESAAGPNAVPGNPFAMGTPPSASSSENPYQAPGSYAYLAPSDARVSGPATGLMVTAILGLIANGLGLVSNLFQVGVAQRGMAQAPNQLPFVFGFGINIVFGLIGLAVGTIVFIGATKMKRLENYSMSMAAAILAMIPCISPCCPLGLPFGIWALIVLNDESVKASFRS